MPANSLVILAIATPEAWPEKLPNPKYQIGENVIWANVPTHGYGRIIGLIDLLHESANQAQLEIHDACK